MSASPSLSLSLSSASAFPSLSSAATPSSLSYMYMRLISAHSVGSGAEGQRAAWLGGILGDEYEFICIIFNTPFRCRCVACANELCVCVCECRCSCVCVLIIIFHRLVEHIRALQLPLSLSLCFPTCTLSVKNFFFSKICSDFFHATFFFSRVFSFCILMRATFNSFASSHPN